jgi:drug/metabolite transporter (DMT)-like permease
MTTVTRASSDRTRGILWALAAGLCWGGAFIAPLVLQGYSAFEITAGRFTGSGLFSVLMLCVGWISGQNRGLGRPSIWLTAFLLALAGNFIYFAAVTAGVQRANAAIVTLIIGTLPIAIPLVAQVSDGSFAWRKTLLPSVLIFAGLLGVHFGAHTSSADGGYDVRYVTGLGLAVIALVSWTIFAIANARVMKTLPGLSAASWSSLQGVVLLPLVLPILAVTIMAGATHGGGGDRAPLTTFLGVSIALGIVTSWMAIWCWNRASQLLPQALAGQLLVFETIASLCYVYLWYGTWPPVLVVAGAALLIGGVILGIRRMS